MTRFSLVTRLYLLARVNQQIWEVVGGPRLSQGTANVFAAMLIKSIAADLKDKKIASRLNTAGKSVFSEGTKGMSYDDDTWPCGNDPIFGPHPHFGQLFEGFDPLGMALTPFSAGDAELNPQPIPPGHQLIGAMISMISEIVSSKQTGAELKEIGSVLMRMITILFVFRMLCAEHK